ncbi:Deformed epidermal autoregulatory factor 1 [Thelohanellus kitauei]|uniref:Deformed epidermal autoregulatory factor 1 n=1 Tax=Thelohanellus kitauei TaxID=669202 RepID=A0A0C2J248_THEKT|nr:Deformed epidermal autoregulatory factor 1 [Thelohanellus kitauei]
MSNDDPGFHQISEIVSALITGSQQLKNMVAQLRSELETMRESEINQARYQAEMEKHDVCLANNRLCFLSVPKYVDQDVLFQQILTHLQIDPNINKSCSNCGREACLECMACRRAWYCTSFCQQRDWNIHQHHCNIIPGSESILASSQIQVVQDGHTQEPSEVDNLHSN